MQTRREFLKTATGSSLALGLASPVDGAPDQDGEWRNRQSDMAYRRLGRTGFMVSEIVMGGNEITPENYQHVLLALDMGLNYLDTSPAYGRGRSEQGFAKIIKARPRDQFFVTSKISPWDNNRNDLYEQIFASLSESEQAKLRRQAAEQIEHRKAADSDYLVNYFPSQRRELERSTLSNVMEKQHGHKIDRNKNYMRLIVDSVDGSLARLGTDHLDIVMCPHGASSPKEVTDYPEIFEAFEILKKAGKVRHLGVSSHSDPAAVLSATIRAGVYSMAMVAYNIVNHPYLAPALTAARQQDLGVIAMKVARPVHPGPNRGTPNPRRVEKLQATVGGDWKVPQKAYLWGLRNQNLSAVISNMVNVEQVKDNVPLPSAAVPG